ncbi:MAG: DivIVA domain-containing protein [Leucobacter sp.]|nr:DivIVA domain-containing protein [Leucobacter sp.]
MALTAEDVLNQKFTITKFRDGYDLDQVDEFLDTIVEEIREREQQEAELREQLAAANAEIESLKAAAAGAEQTPASERTIVVDAPQQAVATSEPKVSNEADAIKSSAMLQLALELHDKHVHDGETKRDQLVNAAKEKADKLVNEAETKRADVLRRLEGESDDLRGVISELREFEGEYRSTLRSYIQSQLRNLDGSPEPDGAPSGLR